MSFIPFIPKSKNRKGILRIEVGDIQQLQPKQHKTQTKYKKPPKTQSTGKKFCQKPTTTTKDNSSVFLTSKQYNYLFSLKKTKKNHCFYKLQY